MKQDKDVVIIGGGLSGLLGAIHLQKNNANVLLIEKAAYPMHKVCGEYISNEVLPYLQWLNIDITGLQPAYISTFEFSTLSGKAITAKLHTGGFGISRYTLDNFLYHEAVKRGVTILQETVNNIEFKNDMFTVKAGDKLFTAKIVIGAYGKRSNLDYTLNRPFTAKKSAWLAVKAHYSGDFDDCKVAIHNFSGGYCGVSKVEDGIINICYLADYTTFKKFKNIDEYQSNVLYKNKNLKTIFLNSNMLFDKPLTISQIYFDRKEPICNHILMTGDTAGLIHPLCGNGMAMAIHSAKIAAGFITDFLSGKINSRKALEAAYTREWQKQFRKRLFMGKIMAKLLQHKKLTVTALKIISMFPGLLQFIIKQTHGRPITIEE